VKRTRLSGVIAVGLVAANVAWFAGLMRLLGEGMAGVLSAIAKTEGDQRTAILAIVVAAAISGVPALILWRWSWYRGVLRQTQEDVRSLWGLPPQATPVGGAGLQRVAGASATVVVVVVTLAALMPGVIPAATAVLIGLVGRAALAIVMVGAAKA
jgi:hypothetical protein